MPNDPQQNTGTPQAPPAQEVEAFLSRLSAKSRTAIDRYLATLDESNAAHAALWRRLAILLAKLAPDALETSGQAAVQFFIADGKYRMQVYALEDLRDGNLSVYTNDILDRALQAGILKGPPEGDPPTYRIKGPQKHQLRIETLTAANTGSAPNYYRHMLGWNRKAIRITLSTSFCTPDHLSAVETLCQLAAPVRPSAKEAQDAKDAKDAKQAQSTKTAEAAKSAATAARKAPSTGSLPKKETTPRKKSSARISS
jgi:hypothetical protein